MQHPNDWFAADALDERLAQPIEASTTGRAIPPEQQLLQDLRALHAPRAGRERQLLERAYHRLAISGASSQNTTDAEEALPETSSPAGQAPTSLPALERRPRKRLSVFFQGLAAVLCLALLLGGALALLTLAHPGANTSSTYTTNWRVVTGPHLPAQRNSLWSVSASAENDVWAVGDTFDGSARKTLIEHWNGQQWRVVANPNPGIDPTLQGVAAIAPDNAWAVGSETPDIQRKTTTVLIEHWNGRQWSVVSAPNPGAQGSVLNQVTAVAANSVWAVGSTLDASVDKALIEHWDGKTWRAVSSPTVPSVSTSLMGITAISATDIWAVGYLAPSQSSVRAFIEHWDGKTWSIVAAPDLQTVDSQLLSVSAAASNDVWAVGALENGAAKPLIEHWDGTQWRRSPIPGGLENSFDGVVAVSAHDVWAVGSTNENSPPVLFVHWDGKTWSTAEAAQATSQCQNEVIAITAVPKSSTVWAVGDYVTAGCRDAADPPTLLIQPLFELYRP